MSALRNRRQRARSPRCAPRSKTWQWRPPLFPLFPGLFLALCTLLSACGTTSGRGGGGRPAQQPTPTPAASSPTVYVSEGLRLYALRGSNGTVEWHGAAEGCSGSTIVAKGVIYTSAGDALCALTARDGSLRWRVPLGGSIHSSLALADDVLYFVGNPAQDRPTTGWIGAVRARDGQSVWRYTVGLVAEATPVVANGVVYIGTAAGFLYALRASDGHLLWRVATPNHTAIRASVAVADGVVYSDAEDGSLTALSASDGQLLWRVTGASGVPTVAGGVIYLGGPLTALRARDGAVLWRVPQLQTTTAALTFAEGVLYLGTPAIEGPGGIATGGYVYAVRASDGTILWHTLAGTPDPPPNFGTPLVAGGMVYVGATTAVFPTAPTRVSVYALDMRDGTLRWKRRLDTNTEYTGLGLTVVP